MPENIIMQLPTQKHLDMTFEITRHQRPLLASDVDWVQPNITHLESEMRQLDGQINTLSIVLSHLQKARSDVQRSLQAHKAVFSPVLRLPRDILLQIFTFCLPHPDDDSCFDGHGPRWMLSKVCGLWRDVVMNSATLWSTVILPMRNLDASMGMQQMLEEHLRLSGCSPLLVAIDCPYENLASMYSGLLDLVASHCRRWRFMEIRADEAYIQVLFKDIKNAESIPLLEEVYVYARGMTTDWTTEAFVHAPALRRVDIPRYTLDALGMPVRLTHYSAAISDFSQYRYMDLCPSLEEWHLHTCGALPECEHPLVNYNVLHLRVDHPQLLDALTLPNLQSLLMHTPDSEVSVDPNTAIDSLCRFLERSGCKLETLIAVEPAVYQSTRFIPDVLQRQPSIKTLETNVDRTIFSWLSRNTAFQGLLPQLESLTISILDNALDDPWEVGLAEMLHSRRQDELADKWKCKKLEEFRLDATDEAILTVMRMKLSDLEERGLQVLDPYDYTWRFWEGPGWFEE